MILREFIKRCQTGYNSITIVDSASGSGFYFTDMKSIPEDLQSCKIVYFDSGFGFDKANGMIFGLHVVVRRLPEERR